MHYRRKFGDQRACARCGHDIEWEGRAYGWMDRGGGTECLPYRDRDGEIVCPTGKHRAMPEDAW